MASRAPLAERSAVNRQVLGSIPSGGDYLFVFIFVIHNFFFTQSNKKRNVRQVPVAQLDKASDYESEDWGFKSLQEY